MRAFTKTYTYSFTYEKSESTNNTTKFFCTIASLESIIDWNAKSASFESDDFYSNFQISQMSFIIPSWILWNQNLRKLVTIYAYKYRRHFGANFTEKLIEILRVNFNNFHTVLCNFYSYLELCEKRSTQVITAWWPWKVLNRSPVYEFATITDSSTPQTTLELFAKILAVLTKPGALMVVSMWVPNCQSLFNFFFNFN